MKKFSIAIILILVCIFSFAGCINTPNSPADLGDYDIGYEFEVYPNVEFNYKINDDFIVHISDIKVTLVEKNEIKENDTIEGYYFPYTTKLEINGYTDAKYNGTLIYVYLSSGTLGVHCPAIISEDGTFYGCVEEIAIKSGTTLYFSRIQLN